MKTPLDIRIAVGLGIFSVIATPLCIFAILYSLSRAVSDSGGLKQAVDKVWSGTNSQSKTPPQQSQ